MGQHKFNPIALAAKEGKLSPKPMGMSAAKLRGLVMAEIARVTEADRLMAAARGESLPDSPMLQPPRKIRTWEELDGLVSMDGRYKIKVDLAGGNGQIVPTFPVEDKDYWNHVEYLSTHTFYEKTHQMYTGILQKFGFNVELMSWG